MLQRISNPAHEVTIARRRQVHQAPRRLQIGLRVARPRRHRLHEPGAWCARSRRRRSSAKGPSACWAAWTASWCPAASAIAASPARSRPSASPANSSIPFFGICLGLQCAVIEFARNVVGLEDANTTEIDHNCPHPVVCLLDEQYHITDMGGTMRLGLYPCQLAEGSRAQPAYGSRC